MLLRMRAEGVPTMSYLDYINSMNQQLADDLHGRGEGDPDKYGYPAEHEPSCNINVHGGSGKNCNCKYSEATA